MEKNIKFKMLLVTMQIFNRHKLNVLVACEFSGTVRDAFLDLGHNAVSCDLLPCESNKYKYANLHYQGNIQDILYDNHPVTNESYDLLIAHPPCTYLANSGVRWLYNADKSINTERWSNMIDACNFFNLFLDSNLNIPHIAIENPIIHKHAKQLIDVSYQQKIQPWMFGHGETKSTCLWLKNLPDLIPTNVVNGRKARIHYEAPAPDRWKKRSITYSGIASAMALQWSDYILNQNLSL